MERQNHLTKAWMPTSRNCCVELGVLGVEGGVVSWLPAGKGKLGEGILWAF